MKTNDLIKSKNDCCGCGLCANKCPKGAIQMKEDEFGFFFPEIDEKKCVDCKSCKLNCVYQNLNIVEEKAFAQKAYISYCKDLNSLLSSSSGGVFGSVAYNFIKSGGIVYGCSMEYENELTPKHIRVTQINDLEKLKGSKYVQSSIFDVFSKIKDDLKNGNEVLFSGTPCQVASIKKYTQSIKSGHLYTMDIICHGTPSIKIFRDYIKVLEKKLNGKIINFVFRDKTNGWGCNAKVYYIDKKGKHHEKLIPSYLSSYYNHFLKSNIYRDNCYSCKYANNNRVGDITIGDYWGVEKEHSDLMKQNGGVIDSKKGVSCLLVNTDDGSNLLEKYGTDLQLFDTSFDKISAHNEQLNNPTTPKGDREKIMGDYKKHGYEYIDTEFNKKLSLKSKIKKHIPISIYKLKNKIK